MSHQESDDPTSDAEEADLNSNAQTYADVSVNIEHADKIVNHARHSVVTEEPVPRGEIGSLKRLHVESFSFVLARHVDSAIPMESFMKARLTLEAASAVQWHSRAYRDSINIMLAQMIAIQNVVKNIDEGRAVYSIYWLPGSIDSNLKFKQYFLPFALEYSCWDKMTLPKVPTLSSDTDSEEEKKLAVQRTSFIIRCRILNEKGYGALKSVFLQQLAPKVMDVARQVSLQIDKDAWKEQDATYSFR